MVPKRTAEAAPQEGGLQKSLRYPSGLKLRLPVGPRPRLLKYPRFFSADLAIKSWTNCREPEKVIQLSGSRDEQMGLER